MKEFMDLIGTKAMLDLDKLGAVTAPVIIRDIKQRYGQVDYQIEPVGGEGKMWVNSNRVHEE